MQWSVLRPAAPAPELRLRRRLTVLGAAGVLGLLVAVPLSPPEGDGRQWDNLVLAVLTGLAALAGLGGIRRRTGPARLTALVSAVGALLFTAATGLTAFGQAAGFGHRGLADVLLPVAAAVPLVVCALLAGQVSRTRWALLAVDALAASLALSVPITVFVAGPAHRSAVMPTVTAHVVAGAGYGAAVTVGVAAGLCTVAAAATRRAATAQLAASLWFAVAACALALTLAFPHCWSVLVADLAVLAGVLFARYAIAVAPAAALTDPADRRTQVFAPGQTVTMVALAAAPLGLGAGLLAGSPLTPAAVAPAAAATLLMVFRRAWLARDGQRLREDLLDSDADVRELMRSVPVEVALLDRDLRLVVVSPAARVLLGLPDDVGQPPLLSLVPVEDRQRVAGALATGSDDPFRFTVDGGVHGPVEVEAVARRCAGSERRVLRLRDVSSDGARVEQLERLAFTDPLTGLPNRSLLGDALARVADGPRHVLLLDLDGFKEVNDSAGHEAGDLVLREVARRLERTVRSGDLVARLGGDEFVVLLPGGLDAATELGQRLVDELAAPYLIGAATYLVTASVGIALAPPGGGGAALRDADEALRWAKAAGKSCWRVHTGHPAAPEPAGDLLAALAEGLLRVEYDVLSDPAAGRVVGLQATVVWDHPQLGILPAAEVWAAAERQGVHRAVRQWLVGRACAEVASLPEHVHVGVPLSAASGDAGTLVDDVLTALAASGLAASRLALSFTEEVLQRADAALFPALRTLHDRGVRLALADYGLGLTLWGQLTRVPVDAVTISLRTLATTGSAHHAVRVLRGIIEAAAEIGVRSIIADVDDPRTLATISSMGALAMTGPLLPVGLGVAQAAGLLQVAPRS